MSMDMFNEWLVAKKRAGAVFLRRMEAENAVGWAKFWDDLASSVGSCDSVTRPETERLLADLLPNDFLRSCVLAAITDLGGHCDCEVLMNAEFSVHYDETAT